jgi:hypothetical protein
MMNATAANQLREQLTNQGIRLDGMERVTAQIDARLTLQGAQIDAKFAKQDQMLETMMNMMRNMMSDKPAMNNNNDNKAAAKPDVDLNTDEVAEIDEMLEATINDQTMSEYCALNCEEFLEIRL